MKNRVRYLYIYLFRHGETTFNRDKKFTGWLDAKLTKKGINQARVIAKKLKNKRFNYAFQTKLIRSKQTLKEVLKYHKNVEIKEDNRMIERNYGALNGETHEEFIKKIGQQEYNLLSHGDAIENLNKDNRKRVEQFLGEQEFKLIHRGWGNPPPRGESFAMVEKRVKPFIKDLIKFMKKNKTNVAISAHGNSIRLFRKIMENRSIKETTSWFIPYDKVFTYKIKA
jgi:2,3-bisphosphoglycerate-dependent phosphoglycerate mutase